MSGVRPGDVIAGKFRVERVLGEGGMGYVVAATHLQLGQTVALKFMREEVCTPDYTKRFIREARNTVRLKSKHVSRVLDVGSLEGGAPYMVMEYLEGTDLSEYLHKQGPIPVPLACEYLIQACEAIAEAHGHNIVHRDLKPANLFLTRGTGGEPVVKVLDFGVSKVLELGMDGGDETSPGGRPRANGFAPDSVVTKASDLLGSPSYMAPEQVVSARNADARSDVWSLGVILFRLVSGKAPFTGNSLGELIQAIMHGPAPNLRAAKPDIPPGLEHVVARCLERDKDKRLGDVGELARLLAPYAGPTATPSLERIAILGPALVSAPPPPPRPSGVSFPSAGSAWTAPPQMGPSAPPAEPNDLSSTGVLVWGTVSVIVMSALLIMGVLIVKKNRPIGAVEPPPVVSTMAMPAPPPPGSIESPLPPSPGTASAEPSVPTTLTGPALKPTVAPTKPTATGHPGLRPGHGPRPSASSSSGGDIPSTRE